MARFQSFRIALSDHPRNPELSTYLNDAYSLKVGVDHFFSVANTTVSKILYKLMTALSVKEAILKLFENIADLKGHPS